MGRDLTESGESNEPSYYEIALTSRQVLVSFVVLLTSLLVVFFAGVWIGRDGAGRVPAGGEVQMASGQPPLEEFKFFTEERPKGTATRPAPATATARPDRTLAEEVRATPTRALAGATRQPTAAAIGESEGDVPAIGAAATSAPPAQATVRAVTPDAVAATPKATAVAAGSWSVQVAAVGEEAKAKKIQAELTAKGVKGVVISPLTRDGRTLWRVRVGPYGRRDQAQAVADKVKRVSSQYSSASVTDKP